MMTIFNILVLVIFIIEMFVCFTYEVLLQDIEKTEKAWELISGYLVRGYMFYCLLKGMGMI